MKGIIRPKEIHQTISELDSSVAGWEVEYDHLIPHAGISKIGTGPGVNKKIYEKRRIALHPSDLYNPDGTLFPYDGREVEFEIDHCTPLGYKRGQEQYSNIMQQCYGDGAKVIHVTWDDVKEYLLKEGIVSIGSMGSESPTVRSVLTTVTDEFKKRNYPVPDLAIYEIRKNESKITIH